MRISIIIPVYNVEKYLDECVQSAVGQTYRDIEIILVDDGSSDGSPQICDDWAQKDSRIAVVHQKNQGLSAARNKGIALAKGDYLYFVDSDDYIDLTLCQKVKDAVERTNADIVSFGAIRFKGDQTLPHPNEIFDTTMSSMETLEALLSAKIKDYSCDKVFKRCLFEDVRFPVGYAFEDVGTIYKLIMNAKEICFIPERLYFYRIRPDSIISRMTTKTLADSFVMRRARYENVKKIYPDIAELGFATVANAALFLYDRSLWSECDQSVLTEAAAFLKDNKQKVLKVNKAFKFKLYYFSPVLYKTHRLLKHKIGNVVKRFK